MLRNEPGMGNRTFENRTQSTISISCFKRHFRLASPRQRTGLRSERKQATLLLLANKVFQRKLITGKVFESCEIKNLQTPSR